jgi:hypothetical protein
MRIEASWGMTVLLMGSALMGCSQSLQTVRGQSPGSPPSVTSEMPVGAEFQGPIIGSAPGYGEAVNGKQPRFAKHDFNALSGFRDNNFGYEGGYYAGQNGYYTDRTYTAANQQGCPACEQGRACPQGGCPHCGCRANGCGPGGFPYHYQTYRFDWPQNQVYPPNQVPAGMVQYPYYTLRGPTDFFMK